MFAIDKSAFKPGWYVGYGGGTVWSIRKSTSSYGNWIAYDRDGKHAPIRAWRLQELDHKLMSLLVPMQQPKE